jgi:transposase
MFFLPPSVRIYLAAAPVDMRNSIDGLLGLAERAVAEDVYSGHLFVFISKRRDRLKILLWESGGFVLLYKRLEAGRFRVPPIEPGATTIALDSTQLALLLDGIDLSHVRRPPKWMTSKKVDKPLQV